MVTSQLEEWGIISLQLVRARDDSERLSILKSSAGFLADFSPDTPLGRYFLEADQKKQLAVASILAIGEGPNVFRGIEKSSPERLEKLLANLVAINAFYREIGGIVGYHTNVLRLLDESKGVAGTKNGSERYLEPAGIDLKNAGMSLHTYVRWGIEHLSEMAEIYPVGGAGDRLDLRDERTDEPLPAAELQFCGRSLLSSLVRDLQAKEYLYFKLFGENLKTPIVMMTSLEKNNHTRILEICEKNQWFGRGKEGFHFITQPLVPVITDHGNWFMEGPCALSLKPGGHGVIWKLARESGTFSWLAEKKKKKALLRQINNPIAGTDAGILAFTGIGCENGKYFGFASCPRLLHTAQGMVVLMEKKKGDSYEYSVVNIEYTDFTKKGLEDAPCSPGSPCSKFPANTNILFADLAGVSEAIDRCPIPGMLVNFKNHVFYRGEEVKAGRLESTMQNISDVIVEHSNHPLNEEELLAAKTFVTYNERRKTISVTKNSHESGRPILDTPVGCYYEMLQNGVELLKDSCFMQVPALCQESTYLEKGPNLIFLYHPALGPLYSVVAQKIRGGRLAEGAELQLEIAELEMENIELEGSLIIEAEYPLGDIEEDGTLRYSDRSGKCWLRNVVIRNQGIDRGAQNVYWMNRIERKEKIHVVLKGNSEFVAENVEFQGDWLIVVPNGFRWTAVQQGDKIDFLKEKISAPSWRWSYAFQPDDTIKLSRVPALE